MEKLSNKNPLIYIVMPCYNGEKYLLEQLMSIYYQNYANWYLIFVNDGSTDNSENIIRDWVSHYNLYDKVKIINKENGGVNTAVQRGLEEIKDMCDIQNTDSLVSYCDADDVWIRCKLEIQVEYMVNHPECDLSYHDLIIVNEDGIFKEEYFIRNNHPNIDKDFYYIGVVGPYITSTEMMFKPKFIKDILPFPTMSAKYQAQDWRTCLVLLLLGADFQFINEALVYYRRGHSTLQLDLKNTDTAIKNENLMKIYSYLQDKYPEKDMSDIIKFNEDWHVKWIKRGYSTVLIYFLILLKYPKKFFLLAKVYLRRILKLRKLNKG